MFKFLLKPKNLKEAVFSQRWAALVRADVDLGTIATWDPTLNRNRRILVPIDLQAYVAVEGSSETVVPVTGGPGDPEPFADGTRPTPGVHLHWAMPDALLRGAESKEGRELEMPNLPERWVVLRALFPVGLNRPLLRGWVIDARKGSVTSLDGFDGTTEKSDVRPAFDRLDGTVGGSPLWTASYAASAGRFGFHDPLDDLQDLQATAKEGFTNDVATYVVAGWSSDITLDPLYSTGSSELFDLLDEFGWHLDPEADESVVEPDTPVLNRLEAVGIFDRPAEAPLTEIVAKGRTETFTYADIAPVSALPIDDPARVVITQRPPRFSSLLHGMVTGVPVGELPARIDERPDPSALSIAIGHDTDDIVAALGAATLGTSTSERRASEMLAAAFTSDLLDRLGSPDGMRDIAEREHADTFWSLPGKPLPASKPDELRVEDSTSTSATSVGRKGRTSATRSTIGINPVPAWRDKVHFAAPGAAPKAAAERSNSTDRITAAVNERRTVVRPAPRIFRPQAPIVAVRGARPSLRHHHDGLYDDAGRLRCRYPSEAVKSIKGVVEAADLVPSLGSGSLPAEVLTVVREAMILNPYCSRWLADIAAKEKTADLPKYQTRIQGEMLRMFSPDGRYDGTGEYTLSTAPLSTRARSPRAVAGDAWETVSSYDTIVNRQVASELAQASYLVGTSPSPLGVTAWRQPWVPLWLEWRVELVGSDTLDDWDLGDLDLTRNSGAASNPKAFDFVGRSPVGRGLTNALHSGIDRWIKAEQERDATEAVLDDAQQSALESLADFLEPLDLASASLDGIREQLLGINYVGNLSSGDGEDDTPVASAAPTPMFGGTLRIVELRLVDAFGRILGVPVSTAQTTSTLAVEGAPAAIRIAPRIQHGARWLLRLVDPGYRGDPALAPEAFVNQLEPTLAVNPVAGFLLPDHIDEALEAFDVNGDALGQLSHHEITGAVRWEPAPGRPIPPGAGPLVNLAPGALPMGEIAAGVVRSDVQDRATTTPSTDSSLTSLLRAIDTTLWTIDTYGTLGSTTVAGLVGRPIAVVKATLRLDIPDDLDEVIVTAAGGVDERRAAFDALKEQRFPIRLGDLQRSDDSLLGFYIDDDYDHFHMVDKVVASTARDVGCHRGQLGLLGTVSTPDIVPLSHPILVPEDTVYVRPGQAVRLTMLMLPAGRVHLTSGILPRKALALSDAWVAKGLQRVIPSVRVGPVLVDPEEIRLPKVSLLGDKQQFTRRTGPLTWRDDPIISATQSALLPRMPHEIQEGWVRIVNGDE